MQPAQLQDAAAPVERRNGDKVPRLLDALAVCTVEPLRAQLDEQVEVVGEQSTPRQSGGCSVAAVCP